MIVERGLLIFFVVVMTQLTSSLVNGSDDSYCQHYLDICYPQDSRPCCDRNFECKQWMDSRYRCVCKTDYDWNNGSCQLIPDRSCLNNTDCSEQKFSECSDDLVCSCKSNYVKTDPYTCKGLIKARCTKNYECFPKNSVCINEYCECKCGYLSPSNDLCLPTFFELTCQAGDNRCKDEEFVGCLLGKCYCHQNNVVNNAMCTPLLNEPCMRTHACVVDHSICQNNKCQCESGYESFSNNRCLPLNIHGRCQVNHDCRLIENSKCSKLKDCVCLNNHFKMNRTTCALAIGGRCTSNKDCWIENSICFKGVCECRLSFLNVFTEKCETVLHKKCKMDRDCGTGISTKCSENGTCQCQQGYIVSKEGTGCLALLTEICDIDDDCATENSYCHYKRCQCIKYYTPVLTDGKYSCSQLLLGISCIENKTCKGFKNAVCSPEGKCICPINYYAHENKSLCLPNIGGYCADHKDCQFENSHCINEKCQCRPEYAPVSDNQCVIKTLAVQCNSAIECGEPWHAECFNHFCYCKTNNTLFYKSTCSPLIEGACLNNNQCVIKDTTCVNYHCKCKSPHFIAIANNMCIKNPLISS